MKLALVMYKSLLGFIVEYIFIYLINHNPVCMAASKRSTLLKIMNKKYFLVLNRCF